MPQYMLLIYSPTRTPEQPEAESPQWFAYTQELNESGAMVAGDALQPETATTVRVRDGETVITDGPFAETKEALGGYYLVDVPDLDAALAWAAKIPNVGYGSIEVRPVMVFEHGTGDAAGTAAAAEAAFRDERAAVLATLIRQLGDFQLAEDALQDAFERFLLQSRGYFFLFSSVEIDSLHPSPL